MSSHHIVREKQEPALLLLGLDNFPEELLGQLLEWSPTVITTPHTAEKLHIECIKVDWIITGEDEALSQSDVKLLNPGDDTVTAAALKYLIACNYPAVNIVTDVLELTDLETYAGKINLVIFYKCQKIYAVSSGFSKWGPAGEVIKLLNTPAELKYSGLEQTADGLITTKDGFFTLHFKQPLVFVAENLY